MNLLQKSLVGAALVLVSTALLRAQSGEGSGEGGETREVHVGPEMNQELLRLFGRVELRLERIDRLLSDAGAGDTSALEKIEDPGIDDLLDLSMEQSRKVSEDIDRILELAQQQGGSSSGSSQSQQSSSGNQQSGNQQNGKTGGSQNRPQEGESTPSLPTPGEEQPGGSKPEQPGGEKPCGEQPGEDGRPKDGRPPSADDPKNRENEDPEQAEKDSPTPPGLARQRWGELPPRVRDIFRQEGGEEMPTLYRGYIDAWYERLNKRSR